MYSFGGIGTISAVLVTDVNEVLQLMRGKSTTSYQFIHRQSRSWYSHKPSTTASHGIEASQ